MDYIPVYEGEETTDDAGSVKLSPAKVQKLGVKTAQATLQTLDKSVGRAAASRSTSAAPTPSPPNSRATSNACTSIRPASRSVVARPLFEVHSPELVSAQREYAMPPRAWAV